MHLKRVLEAVGYKVKDALEPKIWLFEWPNKLLSRLVTPKNPGGDLDINDLEMTGKLLAWLVLQIISGTENPHYKHIGLFSDNTTEVSWTQRGAKKVRSYRKSAQSISFAETSGKSVTVSGCACDMISECYWRHHISLFWLFQTMALH